MATFGDIPREVVREEILPKLDVKSLGRIQRMTKNLEEMSKSQLIKDIEGGILRKEGWGPERMYDLAKNNTGAIKMAIIKDFLYRLHYRTPVLEHFTKTITDPAWYSQFGVYFDLAGNLNVTDEEVALNPNIKNQRIYKINIPYKVDVRYPNGTIQEVIPDDPNFGMYDLKTVSKLKFDRENFYGAYSKNINLRVDDILKRPKAQWDWHQISQNPNITKDFIFKHPNLPWNYGILRNPNISPQEVLDNYNIFYNMAFKMMNIPGGIPPGMRFDIMFSGILKSELVENPNLTLEFLSEHPEYNEFLHRIAKNNFTRSPSYRYLVYSYIYKLLPEQVTIKIGSDDITADKEFIYGMLVAINNMNLNYDVKWEGIKLDKEDYRMFTVGTANQPFTWATEDGVYNFSSLDFMSGLKKVYETNNINVSTIYYTDKKRWFC